MHPLLVQNVREGLVRDDTAQMGQAQSPALSKELDSLALQSSRQFSGVRIDSRVVWQRQYSQRQVGKASIVLVIAHGERGLPSSVSRAIVRPRFSARRKRRARTGRGRRV